jgi:hypothetical protein
LGTFGRKSQRNVNHLGVRCFSLSGAMDLKRLCQIFFLSTLRIPDPFRPWSLFRSQREVATLRSSLHTLMAGALYVKPGGRGALSPDKQPSPHPLLGEQGVTEFRRGSLAACGECHVR